MEFLKKHLEKIVQKLSLSDRKKLRTRLNDLISVYPFNEYEYIISNLMGLKKIKLNDYFEEAKNTYENILNSN